MLSPSGRRWHFALTPDGARYIAKPPRPLPFALRWLVPAICRKRQWRWVTTTWGSVAIGAVATGLLADTWQQGVAAGVMLAALPMSTFNLRHPVLIDAPAMALALLSALAWANGLWWAALTLSLVAGAVKETAPAFAALFAWSPVLLVGLLIPLCTRLLLKPVPELLDYEDGWILRHPFRASLKYHYGRWDDGLLMLAPWGGAIVGFAALDLQLGACLLVAYAQILVATDTVRLYQWAAPLMCLAAVSAVPVAWLPLLVVLTVLNPWKGNGV